MVLREIYFDAVTAHAPIVGNGRAMTSYISHSVFHLYAVLRLFDWASNQVIVQKVVD